MLTDSCWFYPLVLLDHFLYSTLCVSHVSLYRPLVATGSLITQSRPSQRHIIPQTSGGKKKNGLLVTRGSTLEQTPTLNTKPVAKSIPLVAQTACLATLGPENTRLVAQQVCALLLWMPAWWNRKSCFFRGLNLKHKCRFSLLRHGVSAWPQRASSLLFAACRPPLSIQIMSLRCAC